MIYIIYVLLFIIITGITYYTIRRKKLEQHIKENYLNKNREEFNKQLQTEKQFVEDKLLLETESLRRQRDVIQNSVIEGEKTLQQMEKRKSESVRAMEERTRLLVEQEKEKLNAVNALIEEKKKSVDVEVEAYREVEMQRARTAAHECAEAEKKWALSGLSAYWEGLAQCTQETKEELDTVRAELEDYKQKQQAVNEAILRQRAIDEQQDFYRVCLSQNAIEDVQILQNVRQKLHFSESLNKLIYDAYVSKSVTEMVKRVLQGGTPSGIYKITRLKTGEIYIGKSTNVKDRWIQHCKTVYGAGTIAHSILHTTMAKDGLEQFTFELVEEVPKEKLTEREKYWITFYGSKEYGLNERNG